MPKFTVQIEANITRTFTRQFEVEAEDEDAANDAALEQAKANGAPMGINEFADTEAAKLWNASGEPSDEYSVDWSEES